MRQLITVLTVLLASGCASEHTEGLDGQIFVDNEGRVFKLEQRIGDLYWPKEIDVAGARKALKMVEFLNPSSKDL